MSVISYKLYIAIFEYCVIIKIWKIRSDNMARPKAVVNEKLCVACGACADECPVSAIEVFKGMFARVDEKLCVGCRKCEKICPASVIDMVEKEEAS